MEDEQLKQLIPGFILSATISIYAANYDKITVTEAAEKAKELINGIDLKELFNGTGIQS